MNVRIIGYGLLMSTIVVYEVLFKILYDVLTIMSYNMSDVMMAVSPIANYALPIALVGSGVIHLLWKSLIMEDMRSILSIYRISMMLSTSGYLYLLGISEIATPLCILGVLHFGFHGVIGVYSFTRFMLTHQKPHCCLIES